MRPLSFPLAVAATKPSLSRILERPDGLRHRGKGRGPFMTASHVLLVEDNPTTRKLVRHALVQKGYLVSEAPDGRGAIDLMERSAPDIVIQDLLLPDMDGFELLGRLRSQPRGQEIPILAFSGLLAKDDEARISAAGFDDFIVKPIDPTRLLRLVRAHLPGSVAVPTLGQRSSVLAAEFSVVSGIC